MPVPTSTQSSAEIYRLFLARAAAVMTRPPEDPTPNLNSGTFFCRKLAETETP